MLLFLGQTTATTPGVQHLLPSSFSLLHESIQLIDTKVYKHNITKILSNFKTKKISSPNKKKPITRRYAPMLCYYCLWSSEYILVWLALKEKISFSGKDVTYRHPGMSSIIENHTIALGSADLHHEIYMFCENIIKHLC